jgi:hypothetical protein
MHGRRRLACVGRVVIGEQVKWFEQASFVTKGSEFDEVVVGELEFGPDGLR